MNRLQETISAAREQRNGSAVVVLSGGQDSVTCLFWALASFAKVYCISFTYGQRHAKEIEKAKAITKRLDRVVEHKVVDIAPMMDVVNNSALLDNMLDISETNDKGLPASFVPNRNQLFLTIAHTFAQVRGAGYLVTGVCETDFSGYPDCRRDFIDLLEKTSNMGSDEHIKILTPLMYISKAETFELAAELGCLSIVIKDTLTCYEGDETKNDWGLGCGECPACKLRKNGYYEYVATRS